MSGALLLGLLMAVGTAPPDTTVALRPGDRIVMTNFAGRISVEVWSRPELSVRGRDEEGGDVEVRRAGSRVALEPGNDRKRRRYAELALQVPAWVALEIRGGTADVDVRGVAGSVDVRNVSGDIRVERTSGDLDLYSVEGEVIVRDARGKVTARSEGDDVRIEGARGEVSAQSGSGDIRLVDIDASSVLAETLDGEVEFEGPLHPGGKYRFSVHDGDAVLTLPGAVGAAFTVSTFDGEFTSEFPVTVHGLHGAGRFEFTLGDGGAQVEIEVFDGEIRLLRRR